jgi:hypothetical protein
MNAASRGDHLAWAESYRNRAAKCRSTAEETTSTSFGNCYRLLADHYVLLANLEEDFSRRATAMQRSANRAILSAYPSK